MIALAVHFHSQLRACRLCVADCYCQGVGGIVGLGHFGQLQKPARHFHYLRFMRLAVACYGGLSENTAAQLRERRDGSGLKLNKARRRYIQDGR